MADVSPVMSLWSGANGQKARRKILNASFGVGTLIVSTGIVSVASLVATNRNALPRFLLLFNRKTALVGAEPITAKDLSIPFDGNSSMIVGDDIFGLDGVTFPDGLVFGWSTTANLYTAATAGEHDTQLIGG